MGKQLLFLLVAFLASLDLSIYATAEPRFLGELLAEFSGSGSGSGDSDRDDDLCKIEKPEDMCVDPGPSNDPFCREETCTFVPEYGEEIKSWYDIILHEYGFDNKKGKYRKIIDAGESFTKSFRGIVCENEKTLCGCKDGSVECNCEETRKVEKICNQQYVYKYGYYFVYSNAYFCERKQKPSFLALLYKMLKEGVSPRHFTSTGYSQNQNYRHPYNPYSQTPSPLYFFQYMQLLKKDKHEHLNLVLCKDDDKHHSYKPHSPFGLGIPQLPFPFGYNNHHSPYDNNKPSYGKPHTSYGHSPKSDYYAPVYQQDYNTPIERVFLRIKIPFGCKCEEYDS